VAVGSGAAADRGIMRRALQFVSDECDELMGWKSCCCGSGGDARWRLETRDGGFGSDDDSGACQRVLESAEGRNWRGRYLILLGWNYGAVA